MPRPPKQAELYDMARAHIETYFTEVEPRPEVVAWAGECADLAVDAVLEMFEQAGVDLFGAGGVRD